MLPAARQDCYESADLRALTPLPGCSARSPPSGHLCAEARYQGRYEHPRRWVVFEGPSQNQPLLRRPSPLHKEHFRDCNRLLRSRVAALSLVRSGPSLHRVALFSPERLRDSFLQTRYRVCNEDLLTRPDFRRGLKMRHRFVRFTAVDAEVAEIIVGKIVVGGDGESMRPKRLAVSPVRRLSEGRACQGSYDHYGACGGYTTP